MERNTLFEYHKEVVVDDLQLLTCENITGGTEQIH